MINLCFPNTLLLKIDNVVRSLNLTHLHVYLTVCCYEENDLSFIVLERDTFDAENPNMGFYVAEVDNAVVGYGHYFYTYTLRLGKNMCLQDLYVQEKFRNHRIGDKLMHAIAKVRFQNSQFADVSILRKTVLCS